MLHLQSNDNTQNKAVWPSSPKSQSLCFQTMSVCGSLSSCFSRSRTLLLCDALARGLIQPLCGPDGVERNPPQETRDESRNRRERGPEKAAGVPEVSLDPAALQDLHKASEPSSRAACRSLVKAGCCLMVDGCSEARPGMNAEPFNKPFCKMDIMMTTESH